MRFGTVLDFLGDHPLWLLAALFLACVAIGLLPAWLVLRHWLHRGWPSVAACALLGGVVMVLALYAWIVSLGLGRH